MNTKRVPEFLTRFVLVLGFIIFSTPASAFEEFELSESQLSDWQRFYEEHQTHDLMMDLSRNFQPDTLAIIGVNVIPMAGEIIFENQTVIIKNGKIEIIGPAEEVDIPRDANAITMAKGKFMIPGLTEGHAHTQFSLSQFLVYLTQGITTVREMDGFPWMLRAKEQANNNELLIPNLYVAGHILSNRAWDFFMTQIDTEDQARELVRKQAGMGYDFIKIHNSMPEPLFSIVFDEAKKVGLDVVGHIPNEITIKEAIDAGMRTNEHFKGYLYDMTLEITVQDYLTPTATSDLWNAPSFVMYHDQLKGEEALEVAREENSLRFVPRWLRNSWLEQAAQPMNRLAEIRQGVKAKKEEIFTNLLQFTDKFFTGTDTGGYAFLVPGYALQEEIRMFENYWFGDPYKALKTGTLNPALAMRKEAEMGTLEVGKRGDFVILDENPLEGTENLKTIWGVGVRGTWLHRNTLLGIENSLEKIFSEASKIPAPSGKEFEKLVLEMETLKEAGFPYPDYSLEEIENLFKALGLENLAARVDALQVRQGEPIETL